VAFPKETALEDGFQDWTSSEYDRFPVVDVRTWIERDIGFFVNNLMCKPCSCFFHYFLLLFPDFFKMNLILR
jgi:hypothetical protein